MHEHVEKENHPEGASDRAFGLTVGGIFLAIALVRIGLHAWHGTVLFGWVEWTLVGLGGMLFILGLVAPSTLRWPNRGWTLLGILLAKVVNPIVLGLIYIVTIIPIGLIIRMTGGDPLHRRYDPNAKSYWIAREPAGPEPESMSRQF